MSALPITLRPTLIASARLKAGAGGDLDERQPTSLDKTRQY